LAFFSAGLWIKRLLAITKNGVPEAVLLSIKNIQSLFETLESLSDEKAMKSIRKSIMEANREKWVDFDKVFQNEKV